MDAESNGSAEILELENQEKESPDQKESHKENGEVQIELMKIPESIKFSEGSRGKAFSNVVMGLERRLGEIYKEHYSQDKDVLYKYLQRKFEFWKDQCSHDLALLWLMQGYYQIYNVTHDQRIRLQIKKCRTQLSEYNILEKLI